MCDKAVDDFLSALKFVTDWFASNKMIKKFLLLCTQMKIYPILMKILVVSNFLVMK